MAELYIPGIVPEGYDPVWLQEELERISISLNALEIPTMLLVPQAVEPEKPREGSLAYADGTNWNPGAGAGLYEYRAGAWAKL